MDEIEKAIEKMRESGQEPKGIWCGFDALHYLRTKDCYVCGNPDTIYGLPIGYKPEMPPESFVVVSKTFTDELGQIKKYKPKGKFIKLPKWRKKEKNYV